MAPPIDPSAPTPCSCHPQRPLTRASVIAAHDIIKPHVHRTSVVTSTTLSNLASTPRAPPTSSHASSTDNGESSERRRKRGLDGGEDEGRRPAKPRIRLFFKCENLQRVGAFKVRGAFHALGRLLEEEEEEDEEQGNKIDKNAKEDERVSAGKGGVRERGVVTHSSGNHAQALALAARTHGIAAHIVMPTISTPSKIAATRSYGANIIFSGSTSQEREAVVHDVITRTGAVLIPPYDHADIVLGQGTMALELQEQVEDLLRETPELGVGSSSGSSSLHAVITPCGGGGMLSGVATALQDTSIAVFGAEPSFQGADDAKRGVEQGERITTVKTLTVADGLRTPLGEVTWSVISDSKKVRGLFSVSEEQIKSAMKLVVERMKMLVEPSAVVGLAVVLYNEEFRRLVEREGGEDGWNVGVVLSGGNTTLEAMSELFRTVDEEDGERAAGFVGRDGQRIAENIAG